MNTVIIVFHVIACFALILIVLLQTGKGAQMGAAFGGSSQTLFGSTGGATFLNKLTTIAAAVFMITCLALAYNVGHRGGQSIMENVEVDQPKGPVLPEAKPVQNQPPAQPQTQEPTAPQASESVKPEAAQQPVAPSAPGAAGSESNGSAAPSEAPANSAGGTGSQ